MADIFISYSKPDRDKVVMLAAYLEGEGWTVWWDTNLSPGDPYRDEIMRELAAARVVVVLWSPHSIKSDFVRAEAGQAKAQGKLIPVKVSEVRYSDIPLPFGEMHTEDLSKKELIRAAVVAQLARPAVQPSVLWVATKTLRYQVLTWVGIMGSAITLFANMQGVINLANWAQWLVYHWKEWTRIFWNWALGWLGIVIDKKLASILSLVVFILIIALSVRMREGVGPDAHLTAARDRIARVFRRIITIGVVAFLIVAVIFLIAPPEAIDAWQFFTHQIASPYYMSYMSLYYMMFLFGAIGTALYSAIATGFILRNAPARVKEGVVYFTVLALVFAIGICFILPVVGGFEEANAIAYLVSSSLGFGALLIAPSRPLLHRLAFAFIGLGLLMGLNELSKLGLDVRAPPVPGS